MATCLNNKFVITKGVDNHFVLTIKQDGSTLPMELTSTDTFVVSLVELDTETEVVSKNASLDSNLLSGKIHVEFTEAEVHTLLVEKGDKVDRYYLKPTHKLIVDCSTTNNGDFIAKIPRVYVD